MPLSIAPMRFRSARACGSRGNPTEPMAGGSRKRSGYGKIEGFVANGRSVEVVDGSPPATTRPGMPVAWRQRPSCFRLEIVDLRSGGASRAPDIGLATALTRPFELIPGDRETNSRFPARGSVGAGCLHFPLGISYRLLFLE